MVQKYIETPLLSKKVKFSVNTWIVISTMDNLLTIWIYQMCCLQYCSHKFSLEVNKSEYVHFTNPKSNTNNSSVQTCNLKHLKSKLQYAAETTTANCDTIIYPKIKNSIVSAVLAVVNVMNLRPNCLEVFQATFVPGNDLQLWLIDIKSDPCFTFTFNHAMSSIASGIMKSLAKFLMKKDRVSKNTIGMFDLIHKSSIPGKYEPSSFNEEPVLKKNVKAKNKTYNNKYRYNDYGVQKTYHWDNDEFVGSTYIEHIQANDEGSHTSMSTLKFNFASQTTDEDNSVLMRSRDVTEAKLSLTDLKMSMTRLKVGSKININEAKHYLYLLEKWKTRVKSAQNFYKFVMARSEV